MNKLALVNNFAMAKKFLIAKYIDWTENSFKMETFCKRFPVVGVSIMNCLDDKSLINCKEASKDFCQFIEEERFHWIRIIMKHTYKLEQNGIKLSKGGKKIKLSLTKEYQTLWKKVIHKTPVENLRQLAIMVQRFFKNHSGKVIKKEVSPLHIVIGEGEGCTVLKKEDLKLCKHILEKSNETELLETKEFIWIGKCWRSSKYIWLQSPQDPLPISLRFMRFQEVNGTAIHMAAINGNLAMCRLILEMVHDKNPGNDTGLTPLHLAATNGHFEVCALLIENTSDKNPSDINGKTPLHDAAKNEYLDICKLIIGNVEDKNPSCRKGFTPLHWAAHKGNVDMCKFIIDNIDDVNPVTNDGQTPRDFAERYRHRFYKNAIRYEYRGYKKAACEHYKRRDQELKNQELIQLFPEPKSEPKFKLRSRYLVSSDSD